LAEQVKNKNVSPEEICEESISRAQILNKKLNAIVLPMYEFARERAKSLLPDGPFFSVPFLLKDVHHALKGIAMSQGSEALKGFIPDYESEIVKRFKEAGVLIIGKTNTPEFKLAAITEPKAFGPTRNPWNLEFSCGGSSGGSASAVAARIVPLASGTDEGGSIRIPASYCGLFGLKPSRGRNPVGPNFREEWDGMSTSHVITRSVRDSAAMLDVTMGSELGSPYSIEPPKKPYLTEINKDPNHGVRTRLSLFH
jgi:amidase